MTFYLHMSSDRNTIRNMHKFNRSRPICCTIRIHTKKYLYWAETKPYNEYVLIKWNHRINQFESAANAWINFWQSSFVKQPQKQRRRLILISSCIVSLTNSKVLCVQQAIVNNRYKSPFTNFVTINKVSTVERQIWMQKIITFDAHTA